MQNAEQPQVELPPVYPDDDVEKQTGLRARAEKLMDKLVREAETLWYERLAGRLALWVLVAMWAVGTACSFYYAGKRSALVDALQENLKQSQQLWTDAAAARQEADAERDELAALRKQMREKAKLQEQSQRGSDAAQMPRL